MLRFGCSALATLLLAGLLPACDVTLSAPPIGIGHVTERDTPAPNDDVAPSGDAAGEPVGDGGGPVDAPEGDTTSPNPDRQDAREAWVPADGGATPDAPQPADLPAPIDDPGPSTPPLCTFGCGLVVHEWGTFTSVQGSDGVALGGLHHEDEALPYWVHRRNWSDPYNYYFEMLPEEPLQQLETPVLYFYSDEKLAVRVNVGFPQGIVGQWFPDATSFGPAVGEIAAIGDGFMSWDVTLDPSLDPSTFPPVDPAEIWAPSRRVASTPVEMTGPYGAVEREQFIFYRGLGMFDPPVRVTSTPEGTLLLSNGATEPLDAIFVLRAASGKGTIEALGSLAAGATLEVAVPEADAPGGEYVEDARSLLGAALRDTGLTDDEAAAMVDTWTRSWFGNAGLRVLYVAPRAWADALLPMDVTPAPVEIVRTLVGRIEVITPQEELSLTEALGEGAELTPASLGRFAEPRLRRALAMLGDSPATKTCKALIEEAHAAP